MAPVTAIFTLADLKPRIGMDITDTSNDAELQQFIDETSDIVEYIVGPVRSQVLTEWHDGMTSKILLHKRPIDSIQTVTEYVGTQAYVLTQQTPGVTGLDAFGYFAYLERGVIERTAYGMPAWFAALPWWTAKTPGWFTATPMRAGSGTGRVRVDYTVGRGTVPAHIRGGALELARINYQQTQQGGRRPSRSAETADEPGQFVLGFYVPNRVRELLMPSSQSHGQR